MVSVTAPSPPHSHCPTPVAVALANACPPTSAAAAPTTPLPAAPEAPPTPFWGNGGNGTVFDDSLPPHPLPPGPAPVPAPSPGVHHVPWGGQETVVSEGFAPEAAAVFSGSCPLSFPALVAPASPVCPPTMDALVETEEGLTAAAVDVFTAVSSAVRVAAARAPAGTNCDASDGAGATAAAVAVLVSAVAPPFESFAEDIAPSPGRDVVRECPPAVAAVAAEPKSNFWLLSLLVVSLLPLPLIAGER